MTGRYIVRSQSLKHALNMALFPCNFSSDPWKIKGHLNATPCDSIAAACGPNTK